MTWMAKLEQAKAELVQSGADGFTLDVVLSLIDSVIAEVGATSRHALHQTGGFEAWAWIGEDEFRPGEIGFKQGVVPAGNIPLVAVERSKVDRPYLHNQLQAQVSRWGKPARLVRLVLAEEAAVILPRASDYPPAQ